MAGCLSVWVGDPLPHRVVAEPDLSQVLARARCMAVDDRGPHASWVEVAVLKNGRGFVDITGTGAVVSQR